MPLRIPSSGLIVRVANLLAPAERFVVPITLTNPRRRLPGKWTCFGMMGERGFEPLKAEPTGLQPVPFGHLGTPPAAAAL